MMSVQDLPLKDAKVIRLNRHEDNRGWFTETFRRSWFTDLGISNDFKFDYTSFNVNAGTVRGMHSQTADCPQAKIVSVLNGSILDVLVDARLDSPTFGRSCNIIVSQNDPCLVYVPRGFYHGFVTLEPNTFVSYKLDNYQDKAAERGFMYNDRDLKIDWPSFKDDVTISIRDLGHPSWKECYKFQGTL